MSSWKQAADLPGDIVPVSSGRGHGGGEVTAAAGTDQVPVHEAGAASVDGTGQPGGQQRPGVSGGAVHLHRAQPQLGSMTELDNITSMLSWSPLHQPPITYRRPLCAMVAGYCRARFRGATRLQLSLAGS